MAAYKQQYKLMNMEQELWHGRWELAEGFRDADFPCQLLIAPNSQYWTCTSAFRSALFSCHSFKVLRSASSPSYLPDFSEMGMAQPSWDQAVWKGLSLREHYVLVLCCETFWRSTLGGNVIVCMYIHTRNWLMIVVGGCGNVYRYGMTFAGFDSFASGKIRKLRCLLMGCQFSHSGGQRHSQFSIYWSDNIGRKLPTLTFWVRVLFMWLRKATRWGVIDGNTSEAMPMERSCKY